MGKSKYLDITREGKKGRKPKAIMHLLRNFYFHNNTLRFALFSFCGRLIKIHQAEWSNPVVPRLQQA